MQTRLQDSFKHPLAGVVMLVAALGLATAADAARYTLAGADGTVICALSLEPPAPGTQPAKDINGDPLPVPGAIRPDGDCGAKFGSLATMAGWTGGNGDPLNFVDADGEPVVAFQDIGDGIQVGRFPADGIAYLAPDTTDPGSDAASGAAGSGGAGMSGTWTFARAADGGSPLCAVSLSDDNVGGDLSAMQPQEGCSDAITVLDLSGWKLDGGVLGVHDSTGRQRLTFSQADGPVWIRDPGGSRPLFLIRTGD